MSCGETGNRGLHQTLGTRTSSARTARRCRTRKSATASPDGANVYVASFNGGFAVFDRDQITGELTQKHGPEACAWRGEFDGPCNAGHGLRQSAPCDGEPGLEATFTGFDQNTNAIIVFDREVGTYIASAPASPAPEWSRYVRATPRRVRSNAGWMKSRSGRAPAARITRRADWRRVRTFAVRAVVDGVPDATPAIRNVVVDNTPPETTIREGPDGVIHTDLAEFAVTTGENGDQVPGLLSRRSPKPKSLVLQVHGPAKGSTPWRRQRPIVPGTPTPRSPYGTSSSSTPTHPKLKIINRPPGCD